MRYLILLLTLLFASPAWGAATYDAASSSSCAAPCSSLSWSHTNTGSSLALYCAVSWYNSATSSVSGITYNAVTMGASVGNDVNSGRKVEVFRLVAPATGANTVAITMSANSEGIVGGCISAAGVDQVTPHGTIVTNNTVATSISATITIPTNGLGIDFGVASFDTCPTLGTKGANQTERYELCDSANNVGGYGSTNVTTGSQAMSWTGFTTANLALVAIPINGAVTQRPIAPIIFQ